MDCNGKKVKRKICFTGKELGLLIMLVSVSVLTFSSLVYFAEKDDQNWTFVEAFWWGLLTITTVGYGKQA